MGHQKGGMYYLDEGITPIDSIAISYDNFFIGTRILVILSFTVFVKYYTYHPLFSSQGVSCEFGKHRLASYPSQVKNHGTISFEIINFDVCEVLIVFFLTSVSILIIFADNFSRKT